MVTLSLMPYWVKSEMFCSTARRHPDPYFRFVVADLNDQGRKQYLSNATGELLVDDEGDPITNPDPEEHPDAILKTKPYLPR